MCPCGSDGKESACNEGDLGSIPGSGRSPGERNGNPLQYPCLENSTDREAWGATGHKSQLLFNLNIKCLSVGQSNPYGCIEYNQFKCENLSKQKRVLKTVSKFWKNY